MLKEEDIVTVNGVPLPLRSTRKMIVLLVLAFCWTVISLLLVWGDPANSLHTSAMSWLHTAWIATVFAYVFGAVIDNKYLYQSGVVANLNRKV